MLYIKSFDQALFSAGQSSFTDIILEFHSDDLSDFEEYLNSKDVKCKLGLVKEDGNRKIVFKHNQRNVDFFQAASAGTLSLMNIYVRFIILKLNCDLMQSYRKGKDNNYFAQKTFLFIDEFDAFYHQKVAKTIVNELKEIQCQSILTTHNTSIMTNEILRPDCYFIMSNEDIKPIYKFTDKELREAHNIEKMYRAGAFSNG